MHQSHVKTSPKYAHRVSDELCEVHAVRITSTCVLRGPTNRWSVKDPEALASHVAAFACGCQSASSDAEGRASDDRAVEVVYRGIFQKHLGQHITRGIVLAARKEGKVGISFGRYGDSPERNGIPAKSFAVVADTAEELEAHLVRYEPTNNDVTGDQPRREPATRLRIRRPRL